MKKTFIWILILIIIIVLGAFFYAHVHSPSSLSSPSTPKSNTTAIANVTYICDNSHTIHAVFYQGSTTQSQPGQPPVPNGSVAVRLDKGPTTTLSQTISADGARYSDGDPKITQDKPGAESFVFWSKGNSALIMRNDKMDLTYTNCTQQ